MKARALIFAAIATLHSASARVPGAYDEMMIRYVEYFTPIPGAKVAANAGK